jgi:hypothetical protein
MEEKNPKIGSNFFLNTIFIYFINFFKIIINFEMTKILIDFERQIPINDNSDLVSAQIKLIAVEIFEIIKLFKI